MGHIALGSRSNDSQGFAWGQVLRHRYPHALDAYNELVKAETGDRARTKLLMERGIVLLCLESHKLPLADFQEANALEFRKLMPKSGEYLMKAATALWILRRREEAVEALMHAVDGLVDGTIGFADLAGGARQGLLLWYAATTTKSRRLHRRALMFLEQLSKGHRIQHWPGPVCLFSLGVLSFSEIINDILPNAGLAECQSAAKRDPGKRRKLCTALFYAGVRHRACGEEYKCLEFMRLCSNLENPIVENEWYLARAEVE